MQVGFADFVFEQGGLRSVAPLIEQIQRIEEVDQRHIEVALLAVESRQHHQGVAQQGRVADGVEVVGRLIGILQRFLWFLLLLIEFHYLVRQQAKKERIIEAFGLLLGIYIFSQCQLWLLQRAIKVAADGADPGTGEGIGGLGGPDPRICQVGLGIIEVLVLDVVAGALQAAINLQLALLERGDGQLFVQLIHQGAAGALVIRFEGLAADLEIEAVGLEFRLPLFVCQRHRLVERLLGGLILTQLQQTLPFEQMGAYGLGRRAVAQDGLAITELLAIADDLLGIIGCARQEGGGDLDASGRIGQYHRLRLLQIDRELLLVQIQIRS